ncbi:hypothetical protein [Blastococcus sp. SYSU DS0617]
MTVPARGGRLHRWATGLAVLVALALVVPVVQDSGAWAVVLLGVPVVLALAAMWSAGTRWSVWATGAAAVLVLVWSLLLAQGIGLFFLPVAVLLGFAAVAETRTVRR